MCKIQLEFSSAVYSGIPKRKCNVVSGCGMWTRMNVIKLNVDNWIMTLVLMNGMKHKNSKTCSTSDLTRLSWISHIYYLLYLPRCFHCWDSRVSLSHLLHVLPAWRALVCKQLLLPMTNVPLRSCVVDSRPGSLSIVYFGYRLLGLMVQEACHACSTVRLDWHNGC